jgi:hypothetical protein
MSQVTVTSPDGKQELTTSPANARDLVQHAKWVVKKDVGSKTAVVNAADPRQLKKIKDMAQRESQAVIDGATDSLLSRDGPEGDAGDGDE